MEVATSTAQEKPATIPLARFRSLLAELDGVVTGVIKLAARCQSSGELHSDRIARQLLELGRRIDLNRNALWFLETQDAQIAELIGAFDHWGGGPMKFAPVRKFIGRLRRVLSILSSRLEATTERERISQPVAHDGTDEHAKSLNRKLLSYETFNGRSRLKSAPLRHVVHTTTRCNLRCLTCFQSASQEIIHHDIADTPFDAMLPAVRLAQQVMIAGTGETLLSRSAPSLLATYKAAGVFVELITNGTALWRVSRMVSESVS